MQPANPRSPSDLPLALGLGAVALVAYIFTAGPTFYWLDSSELVAAAWGLGVAHPPGHPLASVIARIVCYLPVGTIAFRVTLACALQAAAATTFIALIATRLVRRLHDDDALRRTDRFAIAIATLTAGFSYALWFQAVRAEVYALNALVILLAIHLLLRWDATGDRRAVIGAAFVGGLGLCNHHFLVLLTVPGVALFIVWRSRQAGEPGRPRAGRVVLAFVAAGLFGLATLAYLPLRAARSPEANWGNPTTVERFAWVVSARAFQKAVGRAATESVEHRSMGAVFAVMGGLGPAGAMVALGGLYLLWRRRRTRRAALLLSATVASNVAAPMLVGFDPFNPDAHGYLAVAVTTAAPGIAVLTAAVLRGLSARPTLVKAAGVVLCAPVVYQLAVQPSRVDLRDHWAAEATARAMVGDAAPGALVMTSYFESIFNAWALSTTTDARADVDVLHRNFLLQPGYVEDASKRWPELATQLQAWRGLGQPSIDDLDALAEIRPVYLEHDLNVPAEIAKRLHPTGVALAYIPSKRPVRFNEAAHHVRIARWERAVGSTDESETRRALTWTHFLLARYGCATGRIALGWAHLKRARQLAPKSRHLEELAAACGKGRPPPVL